jgi:hypothetical protein
MFVVRVEDEFDIKRIIKIVKKAECGNIGFFIYVNV